MIVVFGQGREMNRAALRYKRLRTTIGHAVCNTHLLVTSLSFHALSCNLNRTEVSHNATQSNVLHVAQQCFANI